MSTELEALRTSSSSHTTHVHLPVVSCTEEAWLGPSPEAGQGLMGSGHTSRLSRYLLHLRLHSDHRAELGCPLVDRCTIAWVAKPGSKIGTTLTI